MKKIFRTTTVVFALGILLLNSGCKKDASETPVLEDNQMMTGDTLETMPADTMVVPGDPAAPDVSAATGGASTTNSGNNRSNTKANGQSDDGYGAADGTDAENHDGDQYTKNNKKPMPSGSTSIK